RAALMLFILGGLMLTCGVVCSGFGVMVPQEYLQSVAERRGVPVSTQGMKATYLLLGMASLLGGLIEIVLGLFVRRGSIGAAVTAIVLSSLEILLTVVFLLATLASASSVGGNISAMVLLSDCLLLLPLTLCAVQLVLLIQAARSSSQLR